MLDEPARKVIAAAGGFIDLMCPLTATSINRRSSDTELSEPPLRLQRKGPLALGLFVKTTWTFTPCLHSKPLEPATPNGAATAREPIYIRLAIPATKRAKALILSGAKTVSTRPRIPVGPAFSPTAT